MKVVIVKEIDEMPKDCDSCPFQDFDRNCGILGEYTMLNEWVEDAPYYDLKGKGDCPLKPMPQKKEETFAYWIARGCNDPESYINGWNACIDELLGETE